MEGGIGKGFKSGKEEVRKIIRRKRMRIGEENGGREG